MKAISKIALTIASTAILLGAVSTSMAAAKVGAKSSTGWCSTSQAGILLIYYPSWLFSPTVTSNVSTYKDSGGNPPASPTADTYNYTCINPGTYTISGNVATGWSNASGSAVPFTINMPTTVANSYAFAVIAPDAATLQDYAGTYNGDCNPSNPQGGPGYAYMTCTTSYHQQ